MSSPSIDIDDLVAIMRTCADSAAADGVRATVDRSPNDGRPKHAAWVTFSSAAGESQVTVWDTGEAEVEIGIGDGLSQVHHESLSTSDARAVLADTLQAILDA